jgi:hypothetical protein
MRYLVVFALLLVAAANANSQISSHTPKDFSNQANSSAAPVKSAFDVSNKPVARVNGAVLTDRDLLREMLDIFPYARQHNGFPKAQEASIREGALQMIIFEELVYQEAERRKLIVAAQQLKQAENDFKSQFHSAEEYQQYLNVEMGGSEQALRNKIKRSLLIEKFIKTDVQDRSTVTLSEVRAFYDKNPSRFQIAEAFAFQSISFLPQASGNTAKDQLRRANDALAQAKTTKTYEEFGLLAEKMSEDDYRVNMGDHRVVARDKLPPQVVNILTAMKPGQVSDVIQIEQAYTILRLNAHIQAGTQSFDAVKAGLRTELQKAKYEALRQGLDKKLRANAKVELL